MEKLVIEKDYKGYVETILRDGKCIYKGKTEEEYINEGFLVVTEEELKLLNEKHLDGLCNDWKEITEEQFEDALNVLPPMRWRNGGFYMSERYTYDVTGFYQQIGDKYYTSLQRLSYNREDVLDNLKQFISNN